MTERSKLDEDERWGGAGAARGGRQDDAGWTEVAWRGCGPLGRVPAGYWRRCRLRREQQAEKDAAVLKDVRVVWSRRDMRVDGVPQLAEHAAGTSVERVTALGRGRGDDRHTRYPR